MTTRKLNNHEYAQARIIMFDDGTIALQSYNTIVIEINANGWMQVNGLYSRTTIKHIGWFMRELYNLTYYDAKNAYTSHYLYNVLTGEIKWAD